MAPRLFFFMQWLICITKFYINWWTNLYSCFFKTKSKKGEIEHFSTEQSTHCTPHQQPFTPLIPYTVECGMLLGLYALGWIASQEALPLTCLSLFKANIYVICKLRSARFRENGKRGGCAYMVHFFFLQLPDECNTVSEAWVVKQPARQSQEVQASPEVPVVAAKLHSSEKMEGNSPGKSTSRGKISSTHAGPAFLNVGSFLLNSCKHEFRDSSVCYLKFYFFPLEVQKLQMLFSLL